ncbi:MAG: zinc ribbon domain-containing protein [Ruminiclostridium sp.]|nr:zinc ribbon domain-containing protein [Ruminiclostridium sp.]
MFCSKCGSKFEVNSLFCDKCGAKINHAQNNNPKALISETVKKYKSVIIIAAAVIIFLLIILVAVSSQSDKSLAGRVYGRPAMTVYDGREYSDGNRYYEVVEFKSNGICIWKYDYEFFDGNYEYVDGEYIIRVKGDNWELPENSLYRAKITADGLWIEGPRSKGTFVRIK